MTSGLRILAIPCGASNADFDQLVQIYAASIAKSEQKPAEELKAMLQRSEYRFLLAQHDVKNVGFAIVYVSRRFACAVLEYIAVAADERSRGVGAALFREVTLIARASRPDHLVLEVDAIDLTRPGGDQRAARQRFYRRMGCVAVTSLDYLLPLAHHGVPPPMELFVHDPPSGSVPRDRVLEWLKVLYVEIYGMTTDDPRLAAMAGALPEPVWLR